MSRCEKCGLNKDTSCQYAKYMSVVDEAKTDMEFPCEDEMYQEYLSEKEVIIEKAS